MRKIDLYELYQDVVSKVNTPQGGHFRPQTDFENAVNAINTELFEEKYNEWERSQDISDDLAPFLKSVNVIITSKTSESYDVVPYPPEYEHFSSARIFLGKVDGGAKGCMCEGLEIFKGGDKCQTWDDPDVAALKEQHKGDSINEIKIKKVDNGRWNAALRHVRKRPTYDNPIITQYEGGFKIAPKNLGIIRMDYLKTPKKIKFAYTTGTNDQILYDINNSIQLEWSATLKSEFLARLGKRYFMRTREDDWYAASEQERVIAK